MEESILKREINEQPEIMQTLLDKESDNIRQVAQGIRDRFDHVVIAARGTSDNAARYAKYLLGAHNSLQVGLAAPSLFTLYERPPRFGNALVIGISQSGQSPDIVSVLAEAKRQGRPSIAITNDPTSPLAETASYVIDLHAGPEKAIAATKTYTTSLGTIALLSAFLAEDGPHFDELRSVPDLMRQTLAAIEPTMHRVERYRYMKQCAVIGRGYNYATAYEVALKVKELTGVVAEPYSSADFRHGPVRMVESGFPVMVIAPTGAIYADMEKMVEEVKHLNSELLAISDNPYLLGLAQMAMPIPTGISEWISPLLTVLPGQMFALHLSMAKGFDPDQPPGLQKVTRTW